MIDNIKSILTQGDNPIIDREFIKIITEYGVSLEDLVTCRLLDDDRDQPLSEVSHTLLHCPEELFAVRDLVKKMHKEIEGLRKWQQDAIVEGLDK